MQTYFNFFMDLFVLPVCIYAAAYGFAWLIAFVLARLFVNQLGIERAATRAWGIAIFAHMIFGTGAVVWIWTLAIPQVEQWWDVSLFLLLYVLVVIVDICLLVSLPTQRSSTPTPSSTPTSKSLNPKKE
jgi:hypothetical protein